LADSVWRERHLSGISMLACDGDIARWMAVHAGDAASARITSAMASTKYRARTCCNTAHLAARFNTWA